MAKKLKVWNGASWEDVTFAITPPSTSVTNEFTTNQVIDVSTSAAALRITQRGSGPAVRIEDDTNPDSSPFIIDATGKVGMGTASPAYPLQVDLVSSTNVGYEIAAFKQTISGYQGLIRMINSGGSNVEFGIDTSSSQAVIRTNNTVRFVIDPTGQTYLSTSQDNGQPRIRNTYTSTGSPSGGNDGDVWLTYTA